MSWGERGGAADFDRRSWFEREIVVHEPRLLGYMRRYLKAPPDLADGIQETYVRLLSLSDGELARIRSPHAFLFTAARNVAFEWARKRRLATSDPDAQQDALDVLDESPSPDEEVSTHQQLGLLAQAIASLPSRCQQVLTLRRLHGMPQKEIAQRLGIAEGTVEKHAANGVRQCAQYIAARS